MSEAKNQWRCPYCDGLNSPQDEVCQICGDGRRSEAAPASTSAPEIPKTYTPQRRAEPTPEPEKSEPPRYVPPVTPSPASSDPEPPKKKRHGLLWAIVLAALAYGGGKLLGDQLALPGSGPTGPANAPAARPALVTSAPAATAAPMITAIPTQVPTPTPTPTPRPTAAPTPEPPTLKRGSSGEDVVQLQVELIEHNYLSDKADGDFGGKTEAAVKRVQADAGLKQTGVADGPTRAYLQDHSAAFTPSKDSELMFYATDFNWITDTLTMSFKNTGKKQITGFELRLDQCNKSKSALGSFYGKRNSRSNTWWSTLSFDYSISSGEVFHGTTSLVEGEVVRFINDGTLNTVTFFDDGYYVRVTLTSFTTDDGKKHSASQVLYCPFR